MDFRNLFKALFCSARISSFVIKVLHYLIKVLHYLGLREWRALESIFTENCLKTETMSLYRENIEFLKTVDFLK